VEAGLEAVPVVEPLGGLAELATGTLVLPAGGTTEVTKVGTTTGTELATTGTELATTGTELATEAAEDATAEVGTTGTGVGTAEVETTGPVAVAGGAWI
jgi:hypothetical protein